MSGPVTDAAARYYGFWGLMMVAAGVWAIAVLVLLVGIYLRLKA